MYVARETVLNSSNVGACESLCDRQKVSLYFQFLCKFNFYVKCAFMSGRTHFVSMVTCNVSSHSIIMTWKPIVFPYISRFCLRSVAMEMKEVQYVLTSYTKVFNKTC